MQYIYLLREREFIRLNENVYKIGKTKQENMKRFNGYPKGSSIEIMKKCNNCDDAERKLIQIFKEKFTQRTDIGTEYFQGDSENMQSEIIKYFDLTKTEPANKKQNLSHVNSTFNTNLDHSNFGLNNSKQKFVCEKCNYIACYQSDFNRHCATSKHQTKPRNIIEEKVTDAEYKCVTCSQTFKSNSGLWKHKNKCRNSLSLKNYLMKENAELKTAMLEVIEKKDEKLMNLIFQLCKNSTVNNVV